MKFDYEKKESAGSKFIRLADGESVTGVLTGEPYIFHTKWIGEKSEKCEATEQGAKFRFRVNMIVRENKALTPKVLEQGWTVYEGFKDLVKNGYTMDKQMIKISRRGSTKNNTNYLVVPVQDGTLGADEQKELLKLPLHDLTY